MSLICFGVNRAGNKMDLISLFLILKRFHYSDGIAVGIFFKFKFKWFICT